MFFKRQSCPLSTASLRLLRRLSNTWYWQHSNLQQPKIAATCLIYCLLSLRTALSEEVPGGLLRTQRVLLGSWFLYTGRASEHDASKHDCGKTVVMRLALSYIYCAAMLQSCKTCLAAPAGRLCTSSSCKFCLSGTASLPAQCGWKAAPCNVTYLLELTV